MARILVLENDPGISFLLQEVLGHRGHRVETLDTGEKALERLQTGDVDMMISDLFLSGMGGLDVLAQMSELEVQVPVVVISGFIDTEVIAKLDSFKVVTGWLRKPFDIMELVARVESSLPEQLAEEAAGD